MARSPLEVFSKQYWRTRQAVKDLQIPFSARLLGYREAQKGWVHPLSTIQIFNLYWSIEGSAEISYLGRTFELSGTNFFFQAPQEPLSGVVTSTIWRYYWLALDGLLIDSIVKSFGFESGVLYNSDSIPFHLFETLREIITDVDFDTRFDASDLSYRILLFAAQHKDRKPGVKLEQQLVTDSLEIIQQEFQDPLFDVNRLAFLLESHRSQISRAFRKVLNTTPSQYLYDYRLKNALRLIQEQKESIKKIALLSGFQDAAHFTHSIKKSTGLTPRQIRTRIY